MIDRPATNPNTSIVRFRMDTLPFFYLPEHRICHCPESRTSFRIGDFLEHLHGVRIPAGRSYPAIC